MKKLLLIFLFIASPAYAWDNGFTVKPFMPDVQPGDGIAEEGSMVNPYVVQDQYGNTIGKMKPRYPVVEGVDNGLLKPGSYFNPYEFKPDNNNGIGGW